MLRPGSWVARVATARAVPPNVSAAFWAATSLA
eukprot:CAMPEP_0172907862 /NCGR_PEP_ID=MMETSP1075-20121228/179669_1 /TAXON_ID=2916 /ORGANISM="Ceratium fusus, Strain PA161109" /LENGTH=32 /DNA_ID= /DNA_START= /DNA_END= /DNA_ORIENTATION=